MTLWRAGTLWRTGTLSLALGLFACGSAPSGYKAAFARADEARGHDDPLKARNEYETAAKLAKTDEDRAEAYYRAANIRVPGEPAAARLARLDALAAEYPKTSRAPRALLDAARLIESGGDLDDAARRYAELILAYPDAPSSERALNSLLQVWQAKPLASAEVIAKLDAILKLAPALRELVLLRKAALLEVENPKEAIVLYEQLGSEYPLPSGHYSDEALLRAASLRLELGDARGADILLKSLGDAHTKSLLVGSYDRTAYSQAAFLRARIHHEIFKNIPEATRLFREMWHKFPKSRLVDDAVFEVARLELETGKRTEACRTLAELERLAPTSRYRRCQASFCSEAVAPPEVCARHLPPLGAPAETNALAADP